MRHGSPDVLNTLGLSILHRELAVKVGHAQEEAAHDLKAVLREVDLGMELEAVNALFIVTKGRHDARGGRRGQDFEAIGDFVDRIAVSQKHFEVQFVKALEERA